MPKITISQANDLGLTPGIHTIVAHKDLASLTSLKQWLREHGYKVRHRGTVKTWRFNQAPEVIGANFYTKILPNGIQLVFQRW